MNKTMFGRPIMQAVVLALCATLFGVVPVLAQDNTPPPPPQQQDNAGPPANGHGRMGHRQQLERMTKELNLSPDQVSQIEAINADTRKQAMAVRDDSTIAQADKRAKMMDIRKGAQDKVRAVLNDDQKTKYDAMLAKMRERRSRHEGGNNAAPPPPPPAPQ